MFGRTVKPDYVIMRTGATSCEVDTPLYVVEVKRTEGKQSTLLSDLEQHFR